MMQKKIFIYVAVLSLLMLTGIYYVFGIGHHNFYSSICGSGINGIKQLIIYYLPILILITIIILIYKHKQFGNRCKHCNSRINEEFSICPYCGNLI